ncbi:acyl-CoA dehydrogenase family protein [Thermaurantiacus tibetensis]|uniref:acyl-CoA dehydrogenase family protein n=1 Tax=Thermaurantiacus tibetensis TaxID=2759035 RepID=UPI00188E0F27|nr:acyl-CoA dehydrogenase family protein [Thermaurantiacus tibetensis]
MHPLRPHARLATHEVFNQPPPRGDEDLLEGDPVLARGLAAFGGARWRERIGAFARACGAAEVREESRLANANPPQLRAFDRYGHRLDEVEFHPAYHRLMALGLEGGVSSAAWEEDGGHLLHATLLYLMTQADAGVVCPMSMTHAAVAALRHAPDLAAAFLPRILARRYDPRALPASDKAGVTLGMAMTEKQGGSDVRANTTVAEPDGEGVRLVGHKWFCSAPMSDAFLTLARLDDALTCFLVPRWRPDGSRNAFHVMRLKDKLGDRSNASSEIEYHGAFAWQVGEAGRGIPTIIGMVQETRLDCVAGSAAGMRAALVEAVWHARHRSAFQKRLVDQPAMTAVLADLALESAGATALALRLAAAFADAARGDERAAVFARLATPVAKFFLCKRQPGFVAEAMECLGGAGYVEEGPMPRLFRQSPLNAIWEGSGNVIALDVLRAIGREPESLAAVEAELAGLAGLHPAGAAHLERLAAWRAPGALHEGTARAFVIDLALALVAAALVRLGEERLAAAWCAGRLSADARPALYGAGVPAADARALVEAVVPG